MMWLAGYWTKYGSVPFVRFGADVRGGALRRARISFLFPAVAFVM